MNQQIICQICHASFRQITSKHLNKHKISFDEYHTRFPNNPTHSKARLLQLRAFQNPNRGKTYEEIYGVVEGASKRQKISQKQIGRPAPLLAGTGITGTRKDTGTFARSTYEANVDRIFLYENKKYHDEFSPLLQSFFLTKDDGTVVTYHPDRIDVDGLFIRDAILEIKGYMYPEDAEKIRLFRQQYSHLKLLIICPDKHHADIDYAELEVRYKTKIPLWETSEKNYKTRPDLYNSNYIAPEIEKFISETFPFGIHFSITDEHKKFIATKCLNYNKVKLGKTIHIQSVDLISISDRRTNSSRHSSGDYHYELWRIQSYEDSIFYITNQSKTNTFYCYPESKLSDLTKFFDSNCNQSLQYGKKSIIEKPIPGFKIPNHRKKEFISYEEFLNLKKMGTPYKIMEQKTSKHLLSFYQNYQNGKINLDKQTFQDEYLSGLSMDEISKRHSINRSDLTFLRQMFEIPRKGFNYIKSHKQNPPPALTNSQQDFALNLSNNQS